jgi:Asp-tRNA(Asn)/Glu-tRNA(Gln) amidotransferase B subunit
MSEYETRQFHGETAYNRIRYKNGKPEYREFVEPDKREIRFLIPSDQVKVTEIKLDK